MTDSELVQKFQEGDDLAFVMLYNRYKQAVYVFCLKMLRNTEAAKDSVQSVFLKVYERREQLHDTDKFKPWLLIIARNDCFIQLRKGRPMVEYTDDAEAPHPDPMHEELFRNEETALVSRAIQRLKPEYREVVVLREYENLSYKEIADIIGVAENMVKSRLYSARRLLFEMLKQDFIERIVI